MVRRSSWRAVLDDGPVPRRAAHASYEHANGFDKLILASSPEGTRSSWTSGGRICHGAWRTSTTTATTSARTCWSASWPWSTPGVPRRRDPHGLPPHRGRGWAHRPPGARGRRPVERLFDVRATAGTTYSLHHAQLHRVVAAPARPTATLVFQDRTARRSSEILRPDGARGPERRYNPPFEPAAMAAKLEGLLSLLEGGA